MRSIVPRFHVAALIDRVHADIHRTSQAGKVFGRCGAVRGLFWVLSTLSEMTTSYQ